MLLKLVLSLKTQYHHIKHTQYHHIKNLNMAPVFIPKTVRQIVFLFLFS